MAAIQEITSTISRPLAIWNSKANRPTSSYRGIALLHLQRQITV
jgi:hypothetical protein